MYQLFIGADWCTPSEFWRLRPGEVFWIIHAKTQAASESDKWAELYDILKESHDD